jgi:hypothetical protein
MARSEDYTRRALEPFLEDFHRATVTGVRDSRRQYPDTGHIHRKTTRRSIARDHIVHELRGRVGTNKRIRVWDRNQTTYFVVDGEIEVLVKLATEAGDVVLNDNPLALSFQSNVQPDLFDFEKTNLYLGYVDNAADPMNPSVVLICPKEDGYYWMFEVEPPAAEISGEIVPITAPDDGGDLIRLPSIEKTEEDSE